MENDGKRYFTSRIIEDLDARIRSTVSNSERNILFARKAFALARHSLLPEARKIIHDLRQVNPGYEPRLSAWIMFAEGIIEHSDSLDIGKSKDRIIRAHLVGQAANDPSLAGTAAAWLAHFAFVQGQYQESKDYLQKAFSWSTDDDSESRSRATMVLGLAFYFSGDIVRAKHWLQASRAHAVKSGDIAMQNIVLFNSSALHTAHLTLLDCTGTVDQGDLKFAIMSAQSASNLNTALGIASQSSMVPLQRAELLTIDRSWQAAIDIFDAHLNAAIAQGQSKWAPKFIAQRAWCKANTQDINGSRADLGLAIDGMEACTDPDDRCILHFRIASSARLLGDENLASQHYHLGENFLALNMKHQAQVGEYFSEVADSLNSK